jgi:uncharacterized protein (TIGR02246 family)
MTSFAARPAQAASEAIRAVSARWLQAVEAGDADRVAEHYATDGAFLVPNVPLARGRDAVRAVWAQLLSAPNVALTWAPTSVEVAAAGDLAWEMGSYTLSMDGPDGRLEDDGKYVVVWRSGPDGWEVAADIFNSSRTSSANPSKSR